MKTYARIENGSVMELFEADDDLVISEVFNESLVWIDVTSVDPLPQQNWSYDGNAFAAPIAPTLSAEQVRVANQGTQAQLMAVADLANFGKADAFVAGLLDAADTAKFKAWAAYKLALSEVDLSQASPVWPSVPAV